MHIKLHTNKYESLNKMKIDSRAEFTKTTRREINDMDIAIAIKNATKEPDVTNTITSGLGREGGGLEVYGHLQ